MSTTLKETELAFMTVSDLAKKVQHKEVSPVDVAKAVLDRAERHNDEMRVYITITRDAALEQARQAEREIMAGNYKGPMHGITFSLKDNIATKGIRTSHASMVSPNWVPDHDATVVAKLREAGAVLVGKANLSEYAFSANPAYPPPVNPWRADRTSAGSSSGSGVGVAAGLVHTSIGSDTGGSGRAPANVNGCVGFKATYGRVSRYGVFPLSYSLDHTTMMTRTVRDSALLLQATAGYDPKDENSSEERVPNFSARIGRNIKGMRIGFARGFTYENIDPDVVNVIKAATDVFRDLGADIQDVRLPHVEHCLNTYAATMNPEAATIHYDTLRKSTEGLGAGARNRLDLGNVIPATAYLHAQRVRKLMRDGFRDLFQTYDVIIGPAGPTRAGKAGEMTVNVNGKEIESRKVGDGYTNIYSLIGAPAIALPAGFSTEGTPIAVQVAGKWFDEVTVLQVAHAFEQATDWHTRRPPHPKH